jgi:hypothetical protein
MMLMSAHVTAVFADVSCQRCLADGYYLLPDFRPAVSPSHHEHEVHRRQNIQALQKQESLVSQE